MQRSRQGEDPSIRVATTGVFDFDCPCVSFELGDLISIGSKVGSDRLFELTNQEVAKNEVLQQAIGRVARREPIPTRSVLVNIQSAVMCGRIAK